MSIFAGSEPYYDPLVIVQGSTLNTPLEFFQADDTTLYDFTGYSVQVQIHQSKGSATILEDWTDANGKMSIGTTDGLVEFNVTDEYTEAIAWSEPAYYVLELTDTLGETYRMFEGPVTLSERGAAS